MFRKGLDEEIQAIFATFLGRKFSDTGNDYNEKIKKMQQDGTRRLIVNLNDLIEFDREKVHYNRLLREPHLYIPAFEAALRARIEVELNVSADYYVGFSGSFGGHRITPRQLNSSFISKLICVEGIVTKMSLVKPKMVLSVHYCPKTRIFYSYPHYDYTSFDGSMMDTKQFTNDKDGNVLETEYGLCIFKDSQVVTLQEMPEMAPPGQLPCSVNAIVENDLVDTIKPGDRVRMMGVFRSRISYGSVVSKGVCETFLLCNNIEFLNKKSYGVTITAEDVRNIKALSKDPEVFTILSQSLAPSVYGHQFIKKAIFLQLLGGLERDFDGSGIHLRGDINILLVGDPGTAKSQILRFVLNVAPLCIITTGRGASGVGLTAAVIQDRETKERRLEAGAMVLADRGIVCIDEFDKMSPEDRVSIHEVMEQQTVTIAKAGIHASLNARCSVLGAANPIFGKYNSERSATENIALPDSLLSRFDLLFIVLDSIDPQNDRDIAEHVTRMHRYHSGQNNDATLELLENEEKTASMYVRLDKLLHNDRSFRAVSIPFIRRYLKYAKTLIHPTLTEEAQVKIANAYEELRRRENTRTLPVTARTLETMIRLTVAHAKCRLSKEATEDDANVALEILRYALYNDVYDGVETREMQKQQRLKDKMPAELDPVENVQHPQSTKKRKFERTLIEAFKNCDVIEIEHMTKRLNLEGEEKFTSEEVIGFAKAMDDEGKVVVIENSQIIKI